MSMNEPSGKWALQCLTDVAHSRDEPPFLSPDQIADA